MFAWKGRVRNSVWRSLLRTRLLRIRLRCPRVDPSTLGEYRDADFEHATTHAPISSPYIFCAAGPITVEPFTHFSEESRFSKWGGSRGKGPP
jgi:hypothetical protein